MSKTIKEIREKDQFFTKDNISKRCIKTTERYIDLIRPSLNKIFLVEPSAGNGDFYYNFPEESKLAFDIDVPAHINKNKQDYTYKQRNFLEITNFDTEIIFIGNPPFGKSGKLAFGFIEKCIELEASLIAFILPPNINSEARINKIKEHNYDLIYSNKLPYNIFYFDDGEKKIDIDAESVFQIYTQQKYIDEYDIKVIDKMKVKNNKFVQVYTINSNKLKNSKRDTPDKVFEQDGIGKKWIGKCDFYLPLRVFQSKGETETYDDFENEGMSNIGFGVICQDKNIRDKINLDNCYTVGTNKIKISKKQLILKEIMRLYHENK